MIIEMRSRFAGLTYPGRLRFLFLSWIVAFFLVVLSLVISTVGVFLGKQNLKYSIHYTVTTAAPALPRLEENLRAAVGNASVRGVIVTEMDDGPGACGSRVILVEAHVHATPLGAQSAFKALRSAMKQTGVGVECTGMRVQHTDPPVLAPGGGYFAMAALLMVLVWASRRGQTWLINWADWRPRVGVLESLRWGARTAAAMIGASLVIPTAAGLMGVDVESALPQFAVQTSDTLWLALLMLVGAPVFEEYVFRAWLLERFSRVIPAWIVLPVTALLFAAIHVPQTLLHTILLAILGIFLGLLWLRTRSLVACVFAHALQNAVVLAVALVVV